MTTYLQGGPLIEKVRSGNFDISDVVGNPHLADIHLAALFSTLFMIKPEGQYRGLARLSGVEQTYSGFLPLIRPNEGRNRLQWMLSAKKRGEDFGAEILKEFVDDYVAGSVSDTDMAALIAAIMVSDVGVDDIVALTQATHQSGDSLDFSDLREQGYVMVDKHSTGGIADGVSLVLAPLLIARHPKLVVPMMSGRGLGHTGGTLDKLESIPGYRVGLDEDEIRAIVGQHRVAIFGQTPRLAPADGKMYALRDLINCIASNALIVPSILGKKLCEGLDALVMDTKTGNGAFLSEYAHARQFAQLMCDVGRGSGLRTAALITDMNQPLGPYAGNKLEIHGAVEALVGDGGSRFMHVVYRLAEELIRMGDATYSPSAQGLAIAQPMNSDALETGERTPYGVFRAMVAAQGGDPTYLDRIVETTWPGEYRKHSGRLDMLALYAQEDGVDAVAEELRRRLQPEGQLEVYAVRAERSGFVTAMDVTGMGESIRALGAGRYKPGDEVNPDVGVIYDKQLGQDVDEGDILALVIHDGSKGSPEAFGQHYTIGNRAPEEPPLIKELVLPQ